MAKTTYLLSPVAAILLMAPVLRAASSEPVGAAHVELRLVGERQAVPAAGGELAVGLLLAMDEGWHTYWRYGGDSGQPTTIRWELPPGFEAGPIQWPAPRLFASPGVATYGYESQVLLLVSIRAPVLAAPGPVSLIAHVTFLACQEICVPGQATLRLELAVAEGAAAADPQWLDLFTQARRQLPRPAAPGRLEAWLSDGGRSVVLAAAGPVADTATGLDARFFPLEPDTIANVAPQRTEWVDGRLRLHAAVAPLRKRPLDRLRGVLVLERDGDRQSLEVDLPVRAAGAGGQDAAAAADAAKTGGTPGWTLALLYALVGGLLLNLMPCVFPVLSIKVLGFVRQAGEQRWRTRTHGVAYAGGVLVSFWILAVLLMALRAGGHRLGWGFQLQEPRFVAMLALLLFAVGLNLAGLFEFGLGLMSLAGRATEQAPGGSFAGSWFSGVLAVVLAAPCAAPLMGPALGAALAFPPLQMLAVFSALGVGLALPYLVLSLVPAWLAVLPRPGAWMEIFKQLMAFPMFAAAIWLVWVFGARLAQPNDGILCLLLAMLMVAAAGYAFGRGGQRARRRSVRWCAQLTAAALATLAVTVALWVATVFAGEPSAAPVSGAGQRNADGGWEPYTDQRLAELLDARRLVLVDFTAKWCATCLFNERFVLAREAVRRVFRDHDVALLRADWTRQEPAITEALARLGRNSVPLYVVYSPHRPDQPLILPTVITTDSVVEAVRRAAGTGGSAGPPAADPR